MSIWNSINRDAFENDVAALYVKTKSQNHRLTHLPQRLTQSNVTLRTADDSALPAEIEYQLAEDFAFLTAWENIPPCVSAAMVTQIDHTGGIRVSIAANEGIARPVEVSFLQILRCMERCALCSLSRSKCEDNLLDIVVILHRNRIFERLGSSKTRRSTPNISNLWSTRRLKVVSPRLKTWIQDLERKARHDSDMSLLLEKARVLDLAISRAEISNGDAEHAALISVVHAAFEITQKSDDRMLEAQFQRTKFDIDFTNRREFREINAIANYRRVSQYLAKAARTYHKLFRHTSLDVVQHHKSSCWHNAKRFVHAEIQLLIKHENHPGLYPARSIGTSKRACLLCYLFIRAHGGYEVPQTHSEVMPQWTIPDTADYSVDSLARIRQALAILASEIRAAKGILATKHGAKSLGSIGTSAHSTEHLEFASLRTPSMTTLASLSGGDGLGAPTTLYKPFISSTEETPPLVTIPELLCTPVTPSDDSPRGALSVISKPETTLIDSVPMTSMTPMITIPEAPLAAPMPEALTVTSTITAASGTSIPAAPFGSVAISSERPVSSMPSLAVSDPGVDESEVFNVYHCTVSPAESSAWQFDGCSVHLTFEDPLAAQHDSVAVETSSPPYEREACYFRPPRPEDRDIPIIDVAEIRNEQAAALERSEDAQVLEFGLRGRTGHVVITTIQWLTPKS